MLLQSLRHRGCLSDITEALFCSPGTLCGWFLVSLPSECCFYRPFLHVFVKMTFSVLYTSAQLTEGRSARDQPKQPPAKKLHSPEIVQSRDLFKCKVMSGSSRCSIHSCVLLLLGQLKEGKQARMPTSAVQLAKRALVVLLHALAQVYDVRACCGCTAVGRSWCLAVARQFWGGVGCL